MSAQAPAPEADPEVTQATAAEHGLSAEEYGRAIEILGRTPNLLELGIFSVMWSEHCSYKSSKKWLKTLPTEGPQVILGPGENVFRAEQVPEGREGMFLQRHNNRKRSMRERPQGVKQTGQGLRFLTGGEVADRVEACGAAWRL